MYIANYNLDLPIAYCLLPIVYCLLLIAVYYEISSE